MNTNNSEYELIRQEIFRIGAKLDSLPQVYVTRIEHDPWRNSVEKRFDESNKRFEDIEKFKQEGTKWTMDERQRIHSQIQETERHLQANQDKISDQVDAIYDKLSKMIDDKLEKQDNKRDSAQNATWSWRQTWLVFAAGSFVGIAEFIINYLLSQH